MLHTCTVTSKEKQMTRWSIFRRSLLSQQHRVQHPVALSSRHLQHSRGRHQHSGLPGLFSWSVLRWTGQLRPHWQLQCWVVLHPGCWESQWYGAWWTVSAWLLLPSRWEKIGVRVCCGWIVCSVKIQSSVKMLGEKSESRFFKNVCRMKRVVSKYVVFILQQHLFCVCVVQVTSLWFSEWEGLLWFSSTVFSQTFSS